MKGDEEIFADALALEPAARAALLDRACAGDPVRHARLEAMLQACGNARPEFLAPTRLQPAAAEEDVGTRIGRYKLLEKIGEGGCGIVWMAEQSEPVRRRVALKVIKLGMDTKAVTARFAAERQALALMDHSNIAKVLDAGTTEHGRPFFVMELVRGIAITRFCDEEKLTTAQRLQLFIQVCHAIQHAHQKGVIHRDIKPSNILVTRHDDTPMPKVIDFGIAKATQGRLTDATVFTAFEQFMGTPASMSPEHSDLNALDIDTRSDVYSLGVLLYERNEKVQEIPVPEEVAKPVAFTEHGRKLLLEYWDKNEALRGLAEWDVTTGKNSGAGRTPAARVCRSSRTMAAGVSSGRRISSTSILSATRASW